MTQLPIDSFIPSILEKLKLKKNLILKASAGSGKTTRLPPALLKNNFGTIIVLVPKRIAAVSAADRIAEENNWNLGDEVGYHVRFEPVFKSTTKLLFMTEGVFIKKAQDNTFWNGIDVIIFDEFHERSSLLDMALGLAVERQLLEEKLKIVVMSATLDSKSLETFLSDSEVLEIISPPHPLKINYSAKPQRLVCDAAFFDSVASTTSMAFAAGQKDVLVFLPGFSEIRKTEMALQKKLSTVPIQILHGQIKLNEQKLILKSFSQRRIILATDVAESSLTLPSVDAVVDCGLKKFSVSEPKVGFSQLSLQRISQFSAQQRAGRAARTGSGTCYRLWHESDELSMPEKIKPEILKSNLQDELLTLKACGVDPIESFLWLDPPPEKKIKSALLKLDSWELIDSQGKITNLGIQAQRLPLDLESALLFLKLAESGYLTEASHLLACLETLDFKKLFSEKSFAKETDLDRVFHENLLPQGQKIKIQLQNYKIKGSASADDFRKTLIKIFFKYFPHRVAKIKSQLDGLSSLGRGLSFLQGLDAAGFEYAIILSGFNAAETKTDIYFAVGFSKIEFIEFSSEQIAVKDIYSLDLEKKQISKIQSKSVGQFIISESAKSILNLGQQKQVWAAILNENLKPLLEAHGDYQIFQNKIKFLLKKCAVLDLTEGDFSFMEHLDSQLQHDLNTCTTSLDDFIAYPLRELIEVHLPSVIKKLISSLPNSITLPVGKQAEIIYTSENAPMISVKIQDIFGWKHHPMLLDQRLAITLELLAPSRRPTQITQNLVLFWEKSYFDIRKELKPRYPRHPWPDDPSEYIHEKKK